MFFNIFFSKKRKKGKRGEENEIDLLRTKLRGIEKLLEGTKLSDFSEYLQEAERKLAEVKEMVISLDSNSSISARVVSGERIAKKIQTILKRTRKMKRKIGVVLDKL